MTVKKVWFPRNTGNYALRVLGGRLGIVLLAMLLRFVALCTLSLTRQWQSFPQVSIFPALERRSLR